METESMQVGPRAIGPYRLQREVGRGGFGAVWLAEDTRLQRRVAVKLIRVSSPEEVARFEREARMAAGLNHPNIAALYDVGADGDHRYIAMQFIDGDTLGSLRLLLREALAAVRDAARAVAHAHRQGIVHRDLKPENLMRDREGRIWVLDFGLARTTRAGSSISVTGTVVGTPAYMSPEQALGERADERSDVYGLGATLYALVAGRPPFDGDLPLDVLRRVLEFEPPPPRTFVPDLPPDVETVVATAMDKDRARRYAGADALADDLDRVLAGEPISAHPPSALYRVRRRIRRNPWAWALGGTALALLAAASVFAGLWSAGLDERLQAALYKAQLETREVELELITREQPVAPLQARLEPMAAELEALLKERPDARAFEALGGIRLSQGRYGDAAAAYEEALRIGGSDPRVHHLAGVTYYNLCDQAQTVAESPRTPARERERLRIEQERLLALCAEHMRQAGGTYEDGRALVAFAAGDKAGAQDGCLKAWEARRLSPLGHRILLELAIERGELDEALKYAVEIQASRKCDWLIMCRAANALTRKGSLTKAAPSVRLREFNEAVDWLMRARSVGGDQPVVLTQTAWTLNERSELRLDLGQTPRDDLDAAAAASRRTIELYPSDGGGYANLAMSLVGRAIIEEREGRDPTALLTLAMETCDRGIAADPELAPVHDARGQAGIRLGRYRLDRGLDAVAVLETTIADLTRANELGMGDAVGHDNRGQAYHRFALARAAEGGDVAAAFAAADADFAETVRRDALYANGYHNRANATMSRLDLRLCDDPAAAARSAVEDLDRAAALEPENADVRNSRGLAWMETARLARLDADACRRAAADFNEAIRLRPNYAEAYSNRAITHLTLALDAAVGGTLDESAFERALADCREAATLKPGYWCPHANEGVIQHGWAAVLGDVETEEGREHLRLAVAAFERALQINPRAPQRAILDAIRERLTDF